MDKKLKLDDQVLYWDGGTTMDLAKVVLIDKSKSQAKLSNGVILHRTPNEEGIYSRADYKEAMEDYEKRRRKKPGVVSGITISKAWKYGTGNTERLWNAYKFKKRFGSIISKIKYKIDFTKINDLVNDNEQMEYFEKAEKLLNKLNNL